MEKVNSVFADFSEYWHFVKILEKDQRDIVFNSLPDEQQHKLKKSYEDGGWEDVFMRNQIDKIIDELKKNNNIDILYIRNKVMLGKSHYMKLSDWNLVVDKFKDYSIKHKHYVIGNVVAHQEGEESVLLLFEKKGDF